MTVTNSLIAKVTSLALAISPANNAPTYCQRDCTLSNSGAAIIRTFEGYSPFVYKDSGGLPTIGYGHLVIKGEKFPEPFLPDQANEQLMKDAKKVAGVNQHVKVKLKQSQADPTISFTYNVGVGALAGSTLLKKINSEKHSEVPPEFLKWVKVKGKIIQGLVNRRTAEAELYKQ